MISVDGDTSTNDTVLVLANGEADNDVLSPSHPDWPAFVQAFDHVNAELAKLIVKDGEGAQKFIEMTVTGAKDKQTARVLARSVILHSVKTAFFVATNRGRIFCARIWWSTIHLKIRISSSLEKGASGSQGGAAAFYEREAKILSNCDPLHRTLKDWKSRHGG